MSLFLQQRHTIFNVLFRMVLLVLFATTRTNCDPLQVLSTMAPKQDRTYTHGRSKSVAPSARLIIGSDDERDPEYMPPGTSAPYRAARAPRATPKAVASGVVTASQSDEKRKLTGTPSASAKNEEGASGSLGVSWSEKASGSAEVPAPAIAAASASSNEADSSNSTSGSPAEVPTLAIDQPNWWCVDGQFQVYSDAMFTLERWVLTGSLPTMPEIHNLFTRHRLEWTARPLGRYSEEMVREFYVSYVATHRSHIDRRTAPAK